MAEAFVFNWFSALDARLQSGVIAAVVTLIGILLKDLVITTWQERRHTRQSVLSVYRNDADPLTSAPRHLLGRLDEIFSVARFTGFGFMFLPLSQQ
jgi:hypothetical protein